MEFKNYLFYAGAALIALFARIYRETGKSAKYFVSLAALALFISMVVAPAISEWLVLSVKMTSFVSGMLVLFGNTIVDVIDRKLPKKLDEKIDKL